MYRYVAPEQHALVNGIANLIESAHPNHFKARVNARPHVSILPRSLIVSFLAPHNGTPERSRVAAITSQIYADLPESHKWPVVGTCTDIDILGNGVSIIVDCQPAQGEIEVARDIFGRLVTPVPIGAPHVTLGTIRQPIDEIIVDEITSTAADVCGRNLPDNRCIFLGAVSLQSPGRKKS